MIDTSAAKRFCDIRSELGKSARQISRELGIGGSVYSNWESGQAPPRKPNALAIQALYGYRWEWVMTGQEPKWVEGAAPISLAMKAVTTKLNTLIGTLGALSGQMCALAAQIKELK
ncbi:helix-turn-helix transcriptional regulator [Geothrix sp. PMB-07]|uniref:helix-turn-helix domain-containing protein n=1 Tax=Geothrix sp. PMB-07 TaxID=3068640 RepID=UPI0027408E12|nr:helix-turn-helix transcriptional regulator [Geothrix sp. PMB-07]WLT30753.1 helix-turn-helix transcriptional regulator [Geothrix sp. PMB-07]